MLEDFKDKKVYIELNSGRRYKGVVKTVTGSEENPFVVIIDKFGKSVGFKSCEINLLQEEN